MPTIQFTYDKSTNHYCLGFWVNGKFVVRCKTNERENIWDQFCEELKRLEESNDD